MSAVGHIYDLATGQIVALIDASPAMMMANVGVDTGVFIADQIDAATHYIGGTPFAVQARPSLPAPPVSGPAPKSIDMTALPSGTRVTATNDTGDSVSTIDPADPVVLVDVGLYRIEMIPPFPFIGWAGEIEVRDA